MTFQTLYFDEPQYLNAEILLRAYSSGFFPMYNSMYRTLEWHCPDPRAIFPLDALKFSKSLLKTYKKNTFTYKTDENFNAVIRACAKRPQCWISPEFIQAYNDLHKLGFAHSVEVYDNDELIGGLYGVCLGGGFFGESMFSKKSDASKCAFVFLTEILSRNNCILLDSQYINPHTQSLGAVEIPHIDYIQLLNLALSMPQCFAKIP